MSQPDRSDAESQPVRLQKLLAAAGYGSRRHCEEYILAGRVTVDGVPMTDLGVKVDPEAQVVRVDDEPLKFEPKRYYLLNKPPGVVCTHRDPEGRPRAVDLVPDRSARLFTVGRLDENSQGLLLVTNDGELANRLAHPRYGVSRCYRVQVVGRPTRETLGQLKQGLHFADGFFRVSDARVTGSRGKSTFLELELRQGQNREIRRLLARVGHKVLRLERIAFGPLRLGRLPAGRHRPLRPAELKALRDVAAGRTPQRPPPGKPKPHGERKRRAKAAGSGRRSGS